MNNAKQDVMQYLPNMQIIESDMLDDLLAEYNKYDYNIYTKSDVERVLSKDSINIEDYKVLLAPVAMDYLEKMAEKCKKLTKQYFGNTIGVYTPLYIANYCENYCVYCGFNCKNKIDRAVLTIEEIEKELKSISDLGYKEILILTGESRAKSSVEYIGESIKIAKKYFNTIGIEVYPLNVDEYAYLHSLGVDYVSVYQETYSKEKYATQHLFGSKRVFPYRFYSQERALMGGMRGVCFGALLGLDDFRKDAFAVGLHATLVQRKYPHAEISFSVPRMRPFINNAENNPRDVHEKQLLQVMLAYKMLMPFATINISTRECARFRDGVLGLCANKISAGSKVGVGGHAEKEKGDEQFDISDPRDLDEILDMLKKRGFQAIFTDSSYLL